MTRPRTSPTNSADDTTAHPQHATHRQAPRSIRAGEINDATSHEPVDSARNREILVPEELFDLLLTSLPRPRGPDDLNDSAPHGRRTYPREMPWSKLEEPLFEATPVTGVEPLRGASPAARPYVTIDVPTDEEAASARLETYRVPTRNWPAASPK